MTKLGVESIDAVVLVGLVVQVVLVRLGLGLQDLLVVAVVVVVVATILVGLPVDLLVVAARTIRSTSTSTSIIASTTSWPSQKAFALKWWNAG